MNRISLNSYKQSFFFLSKMSYLHCILMDYVLIVSYTYSVYGAGLYNLYLCTLHHVLY